LAASPAGQRLTHFEADVLSQNSSMLAVFKRCGSPYGSSAMAASFISP
jgi:hypothetical protein